MSLPALARASTLAATVMVSVAFTSPLSAQTGSLHGRITDSTGAAVVGAVVSVDQTALRARPSSRGIYTLNGVPTGAQSVRVRALGMTPESLSVNVAPGRVTTVDVTLRHAATRLAAVQVITGSRARHTAAE